MGSKSKTSFLTIFSVFLVLVLIGILGIISLHSKQIHKILIEQINIMVELDTDTPAETIQILRDNLSKNESILDNSIEYISSDQAFTLMASDLPIDFVKKDANPFRGAILFNVTHQTYTSDDLANLVIEIKKNDSVLEVYYQDDFLDGLQRGLRTTSISIFVLSLLLLILAISLIYNTIYLSLLQDEDKIKTKELVGATRRYIKLPYLRRAFSIGWKSAFLACIFMTSLLYFVTHQSEVLYSICNITLIIIVFLMVFVIGISISILSTNRIVDKYLRNLYTY